MQGSVYEAKICTACLLQIEKLSEDKQPDKT